MFEFARTPARIHVLHFQGISEYFARVTHFETPSRDSNGGIASFLKFPHVFSPRNIFCTRATFLIITRSLFKFPPDNYYATLYLFICPLFPRLYALPRIRRQVPIKFHDIEFAPPPDTVIIARGNLKLIHITVRYCQYNAGCIVTENPIRR